jgi:hypothetical protein
MLTYLAAAWLFSVFFSIAAYYGVAWNETILATNGPGAARNRIAEFGFMQFSVFAGLGLAMIFAKLDKSLGRRRIGSLLSGSGKTILAIFLIIIFASTMVAQAYPRVTYDAGYKPIFYDEYPETFQEPYYLGHWWFGARNQSLTYTRPWTGSEALKDVVMGYGWQAWWAESLNDSAVNLNNTSTSQYFTVYYAFDTLQISKPDHLYNATLNPEYVSSNDTQVNAIFNTGRIIVLYKPQAPY